jgi:hypothetical protein
MKLSKYQQKKRASGYAQDVDIQNIQTVSVDINTRTGNNAIVIRVACVNSIGEKYNKQGGAFVLEDRMKPEKMVRLLDKVRSLAYSTGWLAAKIELGHSETPESDNLELRTLIACRNQAFREIEYAILSDAHLHNAPAVQIMSTEE